MNVSEFWDCSAVDGGGSLCQTWLVHVYAHDFFLWNSCSSVVAHISSTIICRQLLCTIIFCNSLALWLCCVWVSALTSWKQEESTNWWDQAIRDVGCRNAIGMQITACWLQPTSVYLRNYMGPAPDRVACIHGHWSAPQSLGFPHCWNIRTQLPHGCTGLTWAGPLVAAHSS